MKNNKMSVYQVVLSHLLLGRQANQISEVYAKVNTLPSTLNGLPTSANYLPVRQSTSKKEKKTEQVQVPVSEAENQTTPLNDDKAKVVVKSERYPLLQQIIREETHRLPECKAITCVDIQNTKLLALELKSPLPAGVLPHAAAAITGIFTEPNMIQVSNLFKEYKGRDASESNFNEIFIRGDGTNYLFIRMRTYPYYIVGFALKDSLSYGMTFSHGHVLAPKIEAALLTDLETISL